MIDSIRPLRGGRLLLLVGAVLSLLALGCSSSEFGPTGSDLPADVSQDSLAIPLTVTGTTQEQRFDTDILDPAQGTPIDERELLYFGTRPAFGLKATPFIQYNFSDLPQSEVEMLVNDPSRIFGIVFTLRVTRFGKTQPLHFALYELADTLKLGMAEDPVASHLGEKLGEFSPLAGQNPSFDLLEGQSPAVQLALKEKVLSWLVAGSHKGVALVDLETETPLVAVVGEKFNFFAHSSLLWAAPEPGAPIYYPRISVNYCTKYDSLGQCETDSSITVKSMHDLTVFERSMPVPTAAIGSYLTRRLWLSFDLSSIPRAATINSAQLLLHIDRDQWLSAGHPGQEIPFSAAEVDTDLIDRAVGDRTFENSTLEPLQFTALVYEASLAQAGDPPASGLPQVLDALTTLRPDVVTSGTLEGDAELQINIADFAQRLVNGIFGDDPPGLLLALGQEELQFLEVPFFDSTAADPTLRPRIEIRFTPPADFGN